MTGAAGKCSLTGRARDRLQGFHLSTEPNRRANQSPAKHSALLKGRWRRSRGSGWSSWLCPPTEKSPQGFPNTSPCALASQFSFGRSTFAGETGFGTMERDHQTGSNLKPRPDVAECNLPSGEEVGKCTRTSLSAPGSGESPCCGTTAWKRPRFGTLLGAVEWFGAGKRRWTGVHWHLWRQDSHTNEAGKWVAEGRTKVNRLGPAQTTLVVGGPIFFGRLVQSQGIQRTSSSHLPRVRRFTGLRPIRNVEASSCS